MSIGQPVAEATPLAALCALEATFDGPIPETARLVAQLGSPRRVMTVRALGEIAFFSAMVRGQIGTIRRRRAEGTFYPALIEDLALYRRHRRAWRRLAAALTGEAPPSDGRGF